MYKILVNLTRIEGIVATVAYSCVALLLMIDVIGREVFSISFLGIKAVSVYIAIVAGFLGLVLATHASTHLRPEVLDRLVVGKAAIVVTRIGDFLSAGLYLVLAWYAYEFVSLSMEVGDKAAVLYFVLWPIQLIMPYAFISCAFRHLVFAWDAELKEEFRS